MTNVVFTGPAVDGTGHTVLREALIQACQAKGSMNVQPSVQTTTNLLVASRTDTVKAKKAVSRGLTVLTYPKFIGKFLRGVVLPTDGVPGKYVDKIDLDLLVPDFTEGEQLADLDVL